MTDIGSHHFVEVGTGKDQVLVPQPSDDPHDPLVRTSYYVERVGANEYRTGINSGKPV